MRSIVFRNLFQQSKKKKKVDLVFKVLMIFYIYTFILSMSPQITLFTWAPWLHKQMYSYSSRISVFYPLISAPS